MTNVATRLITMIMLLQREPGQKASQLAQALDVSVRTVQRYVVMLEEMGLPIYAEQGPVGGYSLVRGYKMPPLVFTPEEAVAVYLGTGLLQEVWGRLYQEAARGALAKLDNVLPEEQRREVAWARQSVLSIGMNWANPDLSSAYLEQLRDAIRERRQVRIVYRSRDQLEPAPRTVDPYKLVQRWGWQYFIGYCHERQGLRSFRLDRISDFEILQQTFTQPSETTIEEYLATNPFFQPRVRARLRFEPEAALVALNNRMYWDSLEEQPDGAIVVSFAAPDLEAAAGAVLRVGFPATILEPLELGEVVREQVRAMADHFEAAQSKD